jgi:hypothetical protein
LSCFCFTRPCVVVHLNNCPVFVSLVRVLCV